jgi:hypothetical protein
MTLLVLESVAAIDTATRKTEKCVTAERGGGDFNLLAESLTQKVVSLRQMA